MGIEPTEEQILEMVYRCVLATSGQKVSAKVLKKEDMVQIYRIIRLAKETNEDEKAKVY